MSRRFTLVLTLAAWLLATGSQWDLVQTYGWGRMIVSYSRSMPLRQAVQQTFSGETLCGVCLAVQAAKQQQDDQGAKIPGPKAPEKIFVVNPARVRVFASPAAQCVGLVSDWPGLASADLSAPPGPPPRQFA